MDLEQIRSDYDIIDMIERMGYTVKGRGAKWCICPLPQHIHSNNTPSFSIFWGDKHQLFKCHGNCGASGDVIDFAGFMFIPGYKKFNGKQYYGAAELLIGGPVKSAPPVKPIASPLLPTWLWEEMLPPTKRTVEYANERGLTQVEIEKFRIGTPKSFMKNEPYNIFKPSIWMSIPTFHNNELVGIKLRNMEGGLRYLGVPGSKKGLFNHDAVYMTQKSVLVVKGEIASMVCDRFGLLSCAPTGGEGSYIEGVKDALILANVTVVGDNDSPEVAVQTRGYAERRATLLNGELRYPPENYKDIDEWILGDWSAVDTIKEWSEHELEDRGVT